MGPITLRARFLDELVSRVMRVLPANTSRDAVFESLRHLSGRELKHVDCVTTAWRLAGNVDRLRRGIPVAPWAAQAEREWIPLEFISGKPFRNQFGRIGTFFEFRAMAGTPCPMRIRAFWSPELCRAVSRRLGFSAPWHSYPYKNPLEFIRLRCIVAIDPTISRSEPCFRDIYEDPPQSFTTWNRRILRVRKRIEPCPRRWTHPCHKCAVGYHECPAGVHRLTYQRRGCLKCGENAYFDDDLSKEQCINCQIRFLLSKEH